MTAARWRLKYAGRRSFCRRRAPSAWLEPPPAGYNPKTVAFSGRLPPPADQQHRRDAAPHTAAPATRVSVCERAGLIKRQPGVARSIQLLLAPEALPILR